MPEDTPVLDALAAITAVSIAGSELPAREHVIARLAKTYAELDKADPNRATAMDSAFLQASLFTSVVAFGVALMAFVVGVVLTLILFAIRAPAPVRTDSEPLTRA